MLDDTCDISRGREKFCDQIQRCRNIENIIVGELFSPQLLADLWKLLAVKSSFLRGFFTITQALHEWKEYSYFITPRRSVRRRTRFFSRRNRKEIIGNSSVI